MEKTIDRESCKAQKREKAVMWVIAQVKVRVSLDCKSRDLPFTFSTLLTFKASRLKNFLLICIEDFYSSFVY